MITQPFMMTLSDWADQIVLDLDKYGPLIRLDDPEKWQDWAIQFCVISGLSQKNTPNPYQYDDWQKWAERMVQVFD